jgi:hypothetical protein
MRSETRSWVGRGPDALAAGAKVDQLCRRRAASSISSRHSARRPHASHRMASVGS